MRAISYDEALAALRGALKFGINPSLDGITELCEQLGRPQDALSVIQVTGTNGKSSTCRLIEALVRSEGLSTGLYTSPELERYPERMQIDGDVVSDQVFAAAVAAALDAAERARPGLHGSASGFTEFELLTAAALWLFRERRVDCAVLEVGLGGRWDATSVAKPEVAVITGVGLDHMAILGDTIEKIAAEKAAIIRSGSVAVLGPGTSAVEGVFLDRAGEVGAPVIVVRETQGDAAAPVTSRPRVSRERFQVVERPSSPVGKTVVRVECANGQTKEVTARMPAYQAANIATALAATQAWLGHEPARPQVALDSVRLPGRFEIVEHDPVVVIDGSHNPQACAVLAGAIADAWPDPSNRPTVVLGVLADKDAQGIVEALSTVAERFMVTSPLSPRALEAERLAETVERVTGLRPETFSKLNDALAAAIRAGVPFIVTGSLTTAGQARQLLHL